MLGMMNFGLLEDTVNASHLFTDVELKVLFEFCSIKKYKKGELISAIGEPCDYAYFINSGACFSSIMATDGKKNVFRFYFKKNLLCDYSAFLNNGQSSLEFSALVDTELVLIPKKVVNYAFYHIVKSNALAAAFLQKELLEANAEFYRRKTLKADELFMDLEKRFPEIGMLVPQTLIASYLDITPVHLSRIKKKIYTGGRRGF
jgi:CRP-like cAMP-binding protein